MSNTLEIFKDWVKDPAHDITFVLLRCRYCTKEDRRKKKFYKNSSSLHFHLTTNHSDEPDINETKFLLRAIVTALHRGILQ